MNFLRGRLSEDARTFRGATFQFRLPERLSAAARAYAGREMVLGIRPEHMHADPEYLAVHDGPRIPAEIEVVEPLGAEIYLYLRSGQDEITARVAPHLRFRPHDRIDLAFDAEKVHLFDGRTELAVR